MASPWVFLFSFCDLPDDENLIVDNFEPEDCFGIAARVAKIDRTVSWGQPKPKPEEPAPTFQIVIDQHYLGLLSAKC